MKVGDKIRIVRVPTLVECEVCGLQSPVSYDYKRYVGMETEVMYTDLDQSRIAFSTNGKNKHVVADHIPSVCVSPVVYESITGKLRSYEGQAVIAQLSYDDWGAFVTKRDDRYVLWFTSNTLIAGDEKVIEGGEWRHGKALARHMREAAKAKYGHKKPLVDTLVDLEKDNPDSVVPDCFGEAKDLSSIQCQKCPYTGSCIDEFKGAVQEGIDRIAPEEQEEVFLKRLHGKVQKKWGGLFTESFDNPMRLEETIRKIRYEYRTDKKSKTLMGCSRGALDSLGEDLCLSRQPTETDGEFRARIGAYFDPPF